MDRQQSKRRVLNVRVDGKFGGTEELVFQYLQRVSSDRFEMHLACLVQEGPLAKRAKEIGSPVHIVPMQSKFDLSAVKTLTGLVKRVGFELLCCYGIRADLVGSIAARRSGIPWISQVPNLIHHDYASCLKGRFFYWVDRWLLRSARAVIHCAKFTQPFLSSGPFPVRNLVYIPNGIDLENYQRDSILPADMTAFGMPKRARVVLSVGRLESVKGHRYMISAFSRITTKFPDVHLAIAGRGALEKELKAMVTRLGLLERVHFLGFRQDVPQLLKAASLFVNPSVHEGLPFAVMEAMAMQVPIVATRVGGHPELLTPWAEAQLVRAKDPGALAKSMAHVLNHQDDYFRRATEGRSWVEQHFQWSQIIPRLENEIEQIIQASH